MSSLPLFIAKRLFRERNGQSRVSTPAIRIAILGVAIGLAVMIVSVSVVVGFKHTIRNKVVGFGSHITVADYMSLQSAEQYPVVMNDSMMSVLRHISGVAHVERFAMKQGILKTDSDFLGVVLKGVGPEYDKQFIVSNMVEGEFPTFSDKSSQNKVVISKTMADKLHLHLHDRVFAYFVDDSSVRTRRMSIVGIYQTNLSRFDQSIAFTDLYSTVRLNGWEQDQASGAEILVSNFKDIDSVERQLIKKVNRTVDRFGESYSSATIYEMYPQIFSWLELMDLNVWVILGLMVAVAGFTMISGLLILILERVRMIGLLKALGATNGQVRSTFLWFASMMTGVGLLLGDAVGLAIVLLQKYTGLVKLDAATYYVTTVPVELNPTYVVLLNVATMIITMIVLILPSHLISYISPSRSIRYE